MDAKTFKRLRLELNYTQKELAEKLGLTDRWVREIEAGRASITKRTATAVRAVHYHNRSWRSKRVRKHNPYVR